MKIESWDINKPIEYARNARIITDKAVDKVAASIKEFGWQQPIVVDVEGVIIAGHTRLQAAKKLGVKKVPVHIAKDLSAQQVKAFRIADNRTGQETEWDNDLLAIELSEFDNFSIDEIAELTAFDIDEINNAIAVVEDDCVVDFPDLTDSEKSDISQMTFSFSSAQAELVSDAIKRHIQDEPTPGGENRNAYAIFRMCESYNA